MTFKLQHLYRNIKLLSHTVIDLGEGGEKKVITVVYTFVNQFRFILIHSNYKIYSSCKKTDKVHKKEQRFTYNVHRLIKTYEKEPIEVP